MKEKSENLDQGQRKLWFVNFVFVFGGLISGLLFFNYALVHRPADFNVDLELFSQVWFNYSIVFSISTILFFYGLRLHANLKIIAIKFLLAIFISSYCSEVFFQVKLFKDTQFKLDNDNRFLPGTWGVGQHEVIEELRHQGHDANRDIGGFKFIDSNGLKVESGRIFPLGGVSKIKSVMSYGALGFHPIIQTDEHGFNNKKGLYIKNDVDIVILGRCILEYAGENDPYEDNIGEQLRRLNFKTVNLVKQGGMEFMLYLATLKEYGEHLRPKVVIFTDAGGLSGYIFPPSPLLMKYFHDDSFSQNLMSRQAEIDIALKKYLNLFWEGRQVKEASWQFKNLLKLTQVRNRLRFSFGGSVERGEGSVERGEGSVKRGEGSVMSSPSDHYKSVITKMERLVSSWGGRLYVLKYPEPPMRYKDVGSQVMITYIDPTEAIADELYAQLGIGIIDATKEVFNANPDPLSLFPYRKDVHPNAKAKRLMAEAITSRLKADGIMPRDK